MGVELAWQPGTNVPSVLIDPEGIHRAVLNIVTNAIDASEEKPGARVLVTTGWDEKTSTARVTINDNGVGVPEDDLASIFQIFASTKGSRGTGLGLPVSQKIVREHGGKITVTSQLGQGAQFEIELPQRKSDGKGTNEEIATLK
jgi:signal transduction histidine kinase